MARQDVGAHGGGERRRATLPRRLGPVHGRIGIAQEVVGRRPGRRVHEPHARAGGDLAAVDSDRGGQGARNPRHGHVRVARGGQPLKQHGELVAAEPRHGVAAARGAPEPLGHHAQQPVPGGVPERVVDLLEVVQVEVRHRDVLARRRTRAARAREPAQRVGEAVAQERPVGQPRERVVERLVGELGLEPPALGHVDGEPHGADHPAVAVAQRLQVGGERHAPPVAPAWREEYNNHRPHSALRDLTPAHFRTGGAFTPGRHRLRNSPV